MRLLCFVLISSDLIGNSPVSNNRTRQKYDRLAWEGARDTKWGERTYLLFSCEKPNALSRKKWRTRYCPSLHSRRPWFVLVYDPAEENLVKLLTFFPQKSCQTFNFFSSDNLVKHSIFSSENLFKLSTFFLGKSYQTFNFFISIIVTMRRLALVL